MATSRHTPKKGNECYMDPQCMNRTFQKMQDVLRYVPNDFPKLQEENQQLKDLNRNLTAIVNLLKNKISQQCKSIP